MRAISDFRRLWWAIPDMRWRGRGLSIYSTNPQFFVAGRQRRCLAPRSPFSIKELQPSAKIHCRLFASSYYLGAIILPDQTWPTPPTHLWILHPLSLGGCSRAIQNTIKELGLTIRAMRSLIPSISSGRRCCLPMSSTSAAA